MNDMTLSTAAARTARSALGAFEESYQQGKSALLNATVARVIPVDVADALLDDISRVRRLVQQWVEAVDVLAALAAEDVARARGHVEAA